MPVFSDYDYDYDYDYGMVQNWPQGAQKTQKISSNFVPFVPFVAKKNEPSHDYDYDYDYDHSLTHQARPSRVFCRTLSPELGELPLCA